MKKISLFLFVLLIFLFSDILLLEDICEAKIRPITSVKLVLENEPEIGGIAILRLSVTAPTNLNLERANISCFLSQGLEFINDASYDIKFERYGTFSKDAWETWGNRVIFYSGPMKKGENKDFVFRVRIPDGEKYLISAYGGETIEIDLGEPEPPEWKSQNKERAGTKDGKRYILSGIKQLEGDKITDLEIPEDSPPPLRTELRIRTKDEPYIKMPYNPKEIPLRYLVYSEQETKEAKVTIELPEGLELINDQNYEVTTKDKSTIVKLYRGPMRFKECKAFYFKVRSDKEECFKIKAQCRISTYDRKEVMAEDFQDIELGRVLY